MAEAAAPTKKDTEIPKECYICKNFFNRRDHRPKILPCGHNVCVPCINKLVETNAQTCPFCRQDFDCENANDLLTNLVVVRRIKSGSPTQKPSKEAESSAKKEDKWSDMFHSLQAKHVADCLETIVRYSNADLNITKEKNANIELSNNLVAASKNIKTLRDILRRLEESYANRVTHLQKAKSHLEKTQEKRTEHVKRVKDIKVKSESAVDFSSLGCATDELHNITQSAKDFEEDLYKVLSEHKQARDAMEKEHQKWSKNIDKSLVSFANFEEQEEERVLKSAYLDLTHQFAALTSTLDDLPQRITVEDIRTMKELFKRRIKEGKVFVVLKPQKQRPNQQRVEDIRTMKELFKRRIKEGKVFDVLKPQKQQPNQQQRQMMSRLSLTEDDEVLVPHLAEGKSLPPESHVVEYSEIMQMVDPSSRYTFIDVEMEKENFEGRMFFRLFPDTTYGRGVFLMSSGEMGTSYAEEKKYIIVWDKGTIDESLSICVNETKWLKDNWGNKWQKEEYEGPWVAGTLCGYHYKENINGIWIYTKDDPHENLDGVIGKVYKGMEVVERLCSFAPGIDEPINCRIKDCGVVIRLP